MSYRLIWGAVSLFVVGCGSPRPVGTGGTGGSGGVPGGQDSSPPPAQCVSVAGRYLASGTITDEAGAVMDEYVDIQQANCDVNAVVPNFGSLPCTAEAPGILPRL